MEKGRRLSKRIGAWLLALVMVAGLVTVPAKTAEAAEDMALTVSNAPQTVNEKGQVEVEIAAPSGYSTIKSLIDAGYTKLEVGYNITSYTNASVGTAGLQPYFAYGSSWTYYTGGIWKNFSDGKSGTITLDFSNTSFANEELKRFGVQFSNLTGAISYSITSAKLIYTGSSSSGGNSGTPIISEDGTNVEGTSMSLVDYDPNNAYYDEWGFTFTNNTGSDVTGIELVIKTTAEVDAKTYGSNITVSYDASLGGIRVYYPGTIQNGATLEASTDRKIAYSKSQGATIQNGYYVRAVNCEETVITENDLDLEIEYNYAKLLQYSLYLYDANMCGTDVASKSALSWRGNCHTGDASVTKTINGTTYTIDVSGGYHDAGDHAKFGLPQAYAASVLGLGYAYFKDAYVTLGQDAHLKNILDRFATYFENCTVLDSNGNVVAFCYQVGEGNADHNYWGTAENQETAQGERDSYVYLTDSSTPCTDIVAESAAALAIYAANYKETDPTNASRALEYAKKLLNYAETNTKGISKDSMANGFYNGTSYYDDMALASIWIHNAIGDSDTTYKSKYDTYIQSCSDGWLLSWDDVSAAAYLEGGSAYSAKVDSIMANMKGKDVTPQGFTCVDGTWGSARYNTALQFTGLVYDKTLNKTTYQSWATSQMQYLLGNNKTKQCFVIGYNKNDPKHPHHRSASGYDDVNNHKNDPMAHTLYGALVGGPNATDYYHDCANDYQYSEVAIDYNAAFVGAAAALYLLNADDGKQSLVTSDLNEVKVYYGPSTNVQKAESISLDAQTASLTGGTTEQLKATVLPAEASQAVTWSSSDTSVATVDSSGKVTAKASGSAIITATTKDGTNLSAKCNITVTNPLTAFSLNTTTVSLAKGAAQQLSVAATTPATPDNYTVSWESSDSGVATVDTMGRVTAVGKGSATITATINGISQRCTVNVTVPLESISLDKTSLELITGASDKITVTPNPADAEPGTVTWTSSDPSVATVSDGTVTAIKAGETTITATAAGKPVTCIVTVKNPPAANLSPSVTGLTISSLEYGYSKAGSGSIIVNNTGDAATVSVNAALEKGTNSSFEITSNLPGNISAGGNASITVAAKSGLQAGDYTDKLIITYDTNKTLIISVSVTVTQREITVTADNKSKVYKEDNPALTYAITTGSLVSGDKLAVTLNTTAETTSNAGNYDIVVDVGSNPNYKITPQKGTLTITPKVITSVLFPTASGITVEQTLSESVFTGGENTYGEFKWENGAVKLGRGEQSAKVVLTLSDEAKQNYSFNTIAEYNSANGTITRDVKVLVSRADIPGITFPTATAIRYGDTLGTSELVGGSTEYGTFAWVNASDPVNEIGTLSFTVVFTWDSTVVEELGLDETDPEYAQSQQVKVTVNKALQTKPATAEGVSRTATGITVKAVDGVEYSLTGEANSYQSGNVFTGLNPFTAYNVYARYAETDTHDASEPAEPLSVYTLIADPYTIDVSKLDDSHYVDALRTESGSATVDYNSVSKELTLADSSKSYTIIGSNAAVTVKTASGSTNQTITLKNTTINDLDVTNTGSTTIATTGTSTVTGTISSDNSVVFNGSGTVTVGEAITAEKDITITGGAVIANGGIEATGTVEISGKNTNVIATGSDGTSGNNGTPAIAGGEIIITDAVVTATGGAGASAISGNGNISMKNANVTANTTGGGSSPAIQAGEGDNIKITIDGGTVTGNNVDNMFSKVPVDSQGNKIATYKVTIIDEAANRNEQRSGNAGFEVILQAAGKQGYTASWKDQKTGKIHADGSTVTIDDDVIFIAVYTKISVESVKVTVPAAELEAGKQLTATVTVLPADALDSSVTWSSSNSSVATVDSKGVITAKAAGTATITATSNDSQVSHSVTITVKETATTTPGDGSEEDSVVKATAISLTASVKGISSVPVTSTYKLAPKKTMTLKVAFAPADAEKETVTFKSSNTKVATVTSKGKITAKKAGTTTITVTSENGLKKSFKVQVMKKAVTKVKITASKKTVKVKKTVTLKAATFPSKASASNLVYWKSSKPSVATVSSTGKVKGIKKGKAKITAIAKDGSGKKATVTITVK